MPDLFHPVRIAIDGNEANCYHRVGSNAYAFEIIQAMAKITKKQRRNFHLTILLSEEPINDLPTPRLRLDYKIVKPSFLWTQFGLPIHLFLNRDHYDVFYTPGHYAPRISLIPYISSVMDLAFFDYSEYFKKKDLFQLSHWTRYSVKKANKIAVISKYTRQQVITHYQKKEENLILAYPAFSGKIIKTNEIQQKKILEKLKISKPYFLYLGTLQPRKNLLRIIDAFNEFCDGQIKEKKSTVYSLVLAGKNGWLTNEISQLITQSPFKKSIISTGFISEVEKAALLENALATFNLGLYEGFGIPALESLAYQTVPIIANNTSLPEVTNGASINIDPFKTKKIISAMRQVLNLKKKEKEKIFQTGEKQLEKFSYEKSANQILTALYRLK